MTVVIPTHDRIDLLPEAVASARSQEGVAVHVVVVDDASSDGTADWLAGAGDVVLTAVVLDVPHERTRARNAGLARVATPYVLFLDDDDVLAPGALSCLVDALERFPAAPTAAGRFRTFGEYGDDRPHAQRGVLRPTGRAMWREVLFGWYALPGANLWRTEALRALGGWDESRTYAEDLELAYRTHPAPVALVPDVVLSWRKHGRVVPAEVQAGWRAQEAELHEAFLDRLAPRERDVGRRTLEARATFGLALEHHRTGDFVPALRGFAAAIRLAPWLLGSPVYAPWLVQLVGRAGVGVLLPTSLRDRVRRARQARRERRYREALR